MNDPELAWLLSDSAVRDDFTASCHECSYDQVFVTDLARSVLQGNLEEDVPDNLRTYLEALESRIEAAASSESTRFKILLLAVTLLNAFLQVNYTGPALPNKYSHLIPESLLRLPAEVLHGMVLDELVVDGERPYPLVEDLLYLLLAIRIVNHKALTSLRSRALWRMRMSFVHQKLLDDPVSHIHNIICDEDSFKSVVDLIANQPDLLAKWHLELAHYYSYYSYDQKAMYQVKESQRISGLSMRVSGALGRRTKFQTFDVSQLVVLAKSSDSRLKSEAHENRTVSTAPKILDLDDDTLLEKVSFSTTNHEAPYSKRYINPVAEVVPTEALPPELAALDPGNQPQLSIVDQCILLTYAGVIKVSAASDDQIIIEQVAAYVARVLQHPIDPKNGQSNWTVNSAALLARTRVEGHRSRTVERSVLQLQALVDQLVDEIAQDSTLPRVGEVVTGRLDNTARTQNASFLHRADQRDSAPAKERLFPIFALPLASKWDLQLELARKYTSIGLVKSALEIFERLESWEQVALCYGVMDREDKAEAVLRRQIELSRPGADLPKLWCLLGDVTKDPQCWETSWTVSGHHYARAQRSLGKWHFGAKQYEAAISAYALSLKINPLNHGAWFIYGCAGLELRRYGLAAEAFTRCISIDATDGESWNNLASALLRLDDGDRKRDAWQALKTATDLKYDSWRMWENYMLVSLDLLEFGEAARAVRRCVEIRKDVAGESAVDVDVLRMLVHHVTTESDPHTDKLNGESQGEGGKGGGGGDYDDGEAPLRGVARMVYDLMTRTIQPLITHDSRLWGLLAKLHLWRRHYAESLDAQERGYRCLAGKFAVETDAAVFAEVVEAVEELVDAYRSLGPMPGRVGGCVATDWKFKSRSVVRTLRGRGKNFEESEAYEKLIEILEDLKGA